MLPSTSIKNNGRTTVVSTRTDPVVSRSSLITDPNLLMGGPHRYRSNCWQRGRQHNGLVRICCGDLNCGGSCRAIGIRRDSYVAGRKAGYDLVSTLAVQILQLMHCEPLLTNTNVILLSQEARNPSARDNRGNGFKSCYYLWIKWRRYYNRCMQRIAATRCYIFGKVVCSGFWLKQRAKCKASSQVSHVN